MSYRQLEPKKVGVSSPMGVRIRKPIDYNRHNYQFHTAVLESGDIIRVEPSRGSNYSHFIVRPDTMPESMPEKTINIATKWGTPIPKMLDNGSPSQVPLLSRDLDVDDLEIVHCRVSVLDPGIQVQIAQPNAQFRYYDKAGSRRISYGNTMFHLLQGNWGGLPEFFVYANVTPVQFVATSTNMNEDQFNARLLIHSFKYSLEAIQTTEDDPRTVMTIRVGPKQN